MTLYGVYVNMFQFWGSSGIIKSCANFSLMVNYSVKMLEVGLDSIGFSELRKAIVGNCCKRTVVVGQIGPLNQ